LVYTFGTYQTEIAMHLELNTPVTAPKQYAKIFTTGRSQAVRLPKAFRFEGSEVLVERQGDAVILRPKLDNETWVQQIVTAVAAFDGDLRIDRAEEWPQSDREPLLP
jgi:antitoxin VapB